MYRKAPSIIAVMMSPGMPRASGISAAPATPLFPLSAAATPSNDPLPIHLGFLRFSLLRNNLRTLKARHQFPEWPLE